MRTRTADPPIPGTTATLLHRGARPRADAGVVRFAGALILLSAVAATAGVNHWAWRLVGAPLAEELVFRAGLQARLLALLQANTGAARAGTQARVLGGRALLANLVTALAFAAAHALVQPGVLAWSTALPGLAIGCLYQRTGRVRDCAVLHALFNAVWFACTASSSAPTFLHGLLQ